MTICAFVAPLRPLLASTMRGALFVALLALGTTTNAPLALAQSEGSLSVTDLESGLQSRDVWQVVRLLDSISTLRDDDPIIPFMVDLWEQRVHKHPQLPWDFIKSDPMRLTIGHELLLWQNLAMPGVQIDRSQIRDLAIRLIDDPRGDARDLVLPIFGLLDEPVDVEPVFEVAKREPFGRFPLAIKILAGMCNSAARGALDELEQLAPNEAIRAVIADTRRRNDELKEKHGYCKSAD